MKITTHVFQLCSIICGVLLFQYFSYKFNGIDVSFSDSFESYFSITSLMLILLGSGVVYGFRLGEHRAPTRITHNYMIQCNSSSNRSSYKNDILLIVFLISLHPCRGLRVFPFHSNITVLSKWYVVLLISMIFFIMHTMSKQCVTVFVIIIIHAYCVT